MASLLDLTAVPVPGAIELSWTVADASPVRFLVHRRTGEAAFAPLARYGVTVLGALFIHAAIVLPLLVAAAGIICSILGTFVVRTKEGGDPQVALDIGAFGAAGVMVGFYYGSVRYDMGFIPGIKAFAAAVLGGIGNITGAMLGGLIIGMVEIFGAGYISGQYKDVFAFIILIGVLYFMPTGIMGENIDDTRV